MGLEPLPPDAAGRVRLRATPPAFRPVGTGVDTTAADESAIAHAVNANADAAGGAGLTWRGSYNPATAYATNDAVQCAGSSYIALASTTGVAPPSAPWDLLAEAGQSFHTDVFQVSSGGQTVFTLNHHATAPTSATANVNGQLTTNGEDYTIVGNVFTWLDAYYQLGVGDLLIVEYQ